jgi:hypothetical protein
MSFRHARARNRTVVRRVERLPGPGRGRVGGMPHKGLGPPLLCAGGAVPAVAAAAPAPVAPWRRGGLEGAGGGVAVRVGARGGVCERVVGGCLLDRTRTHAGGGASQRHTRAALMHARGHLKAAAAAVLV